MFIRVTEVKVERGKKEGGKKHTVVLAGYQGFVNLKGYEINYIEIAMMVNLKALIV